MGTFPLWAHPGCPGDDFKKCKYPVMERATGRVNDSAYASPGYFAINITNTVRAEMTTTHRTALYRFSFLPRENISYTTYTFEWEPEARNTMVNMSIKTSPLILVDLTDISMSRRGGGVQIYPDSGRIIGDGVFNPSFGQGQYHAYFCADFKGAKIRKTGVFEGDEAIDTRKYLSNALTGFKNPSGSAGAWVQFEKPETDQILARVGLSFMSVDQACRNAELEIPDFDFGGTVKAAEKVWSEKLSVIELDTTGVSDELQTVFWSGLYRSLLSPQNYTGENPMWHSTEPYFDSFYCIWDSFRAQHPLLTIVDPKAQTEMIRTLLDVYRYVGKLPDCRMSFCKGYTQVSGLAWTTLRATSNGL
jgi:putative alpha-1,2-mannosidase